jgi:DNA polymerase III delta prime subunit
LESILLNNKKADEEILNFNTSLIYKEFCEEAGMPTYMIDPQIPMDLVEIKSYFQKNIYGQGKAVESIVDLLASVKTALTREGKPIASFLFVGPTGVGKTEMAKVLADFMFGSRERMIRFDMSEYSNPYNVMRLTGESYFKDGLLTSAVRQTPFSVVLFDEIEKAHPVFYDLLLQMLGEGRLTDSAGRLVNFCSTIIIITSNIGASNLHSNRVGWNNHANVEEISTHFESEVRKYFRPELFNRIDQVIPFEPLSAEVVRKVTDREIGLLKKREGIAYRNMDFYISDEVYALLGQKGYDPKYGARQLQRAIREEMVIPLATQLNTYAYDEHLVVNVAVEDQKIVFDIETDPLKFDLLLEELTRNEFADHAGALRRSIKQLQEGSFYVQLTSELNMLEARLNRNKDKFWKDKQDSDKYTFYLATKDRVEKMSTIIENYEEELALVCMNLKPYNTKVLDKIKAWEQHYFDLKVELFTRIHPQSDSCKIGIYGRHLTKVVQLYFKIFEAQDFIPAASTLWFREEYYNEEIQVEELEEGSMPGISTITTTKQPKREYIAKNFDVYDLESSFKPPKPDDIMVGIEIDVFGRCPFLYFSEEEGFHRTKVSSNKFDVFQVLCFPSINDALTPIEIHRKRYFEKQKARRTYDEHHLHDTIYKINREVTKDNLVELLANTLNQRFSAKLDRELI